jgi:hypothetical protein
MRPWLLTRIKGNDRIPWISVADPNHFFAEPVSTFYFDANPDPDPASHFVDADPDPDSTFHFDTDPNPNPSFQKRL